MLPVLLLEDLDDVVELVQPPYSSPLWVLELRPPTVGGVGLASLSLNKGLMHFIDIGRLYSCYMKYDM